MLYNDTDANNTVDVLHVYITYKDTKACTECQECGCVFLESRYVLSSPGCGMRRSEKTCLLGFATVRLCGSIWPRCTMPGIFVDIYFLKATILNY